MTPQEKFKRDKYVLFDDVISKDMCTFLTNYMHLRKDAGYMTPPVSMGGDDTQCPKSWSIYGDPAFDTLLLQLAQPLSNLLGMQLIPAHTYARIYQPGEILEWHKDRPSCEISGTMTLGMSSPTDIWPIYVGSPDSTKEEKVGNPINIGVGELMMYEGCEVPHWRDEYTGTWQAQVFIHYVRANGPYAAEHRFDGRPSLGIFKHSDEYKKQTDRIIQYALNKPKETSVSKTEQVQAQDSIKPFKFEV